MTHLWPVNDVEVEVVQLELLQRAVTRESKRERERARERRARSIQR
jgi:hypothetical protein